MAYMTLSVLALNLSMLKPMYRSIYTKCTLSLAQLLLNMFSRASLGGVALSSLLRASLDLLCPALDEWLGVGLLSLTIVACFKLVLKGGAQSVTSYNARWKLASTKLR